MKKQLAISDADKKILLHLLNKYLPNTKAWAYGSRVAGKARPASDLDLVVFANREQSLQVGDLREAFEESDLTFRVDLFVWDSVPESFKATIEKEHVVLQMSVPKQMLKELTLADISLNGKCGFVDGPFGSALPARLYTKSGIPVIRGVNLSKGEERFRLNTEFVFVAQETAEKLSRAKCIHNDIIFTKKGTLGQIGIIPKCNYAIFILSSNQMRLRVDEKKASPDFIYYFLSSKESVEKIIRDSEHTGVPKINLTYLRSFPIMLPELAEQNVIGSFLKSIDDRIQLLRETNATLEAMAQALFKSWFVDFDPVHAKAEGRTPEGMDAETAALFPSEFEDSELGMIPKGWKCGTIACLASLNPESWTAKKHPNQINYIDLANVKDNVILDVASMPFCDAPSRARRILQSGDTIVGTVRPGNRSFAYINMPSKQLTGSTGFAVLRPKSLMYSEFVYLTATASKNMEKLAHVADGAAYPAVRPEIVAELDCILPRDVILQAFHNQVTQMFVRIAINHEHSRTLTSLRDTLLPRLISGKLRLPEFAEATPNAQA